MKDFKERFNNSFSAIEEKRNKMEEEERKKKERQLKRHMEFLEEEKKWQEKAAEKVFTKYEEMFGKDTLEFFLTKMEKKILPPYNVSYTLKEGLDDEACKILEKKIEEALKKELPTDKFELQVKVEDNRIEHGHEEGDNHAGCWVHDYTEYKLCIDISLNF